MQPELIITPFGESADPATVRDIPQSNPSGAPRQNASWEQGFPLITMTPIASGGIPPEGPDMNGVLRAISRHSSFVGGGGQYKWSAEYVAAKGGYPKGAVIQADNGEVSYVSTEDGNSTNFNAYPDSIGKQWVFFGGATSYFELQFEQEQEKRENEFNQFLINTAFEMPPIPFVEGSILEISRPTQLVSHEGQLYSVRMPASFPVVLSDIWDVAVASLTPREDASLRQQLAAPSGAEMSGYTYGAAHSEGREVSDKLQEARSILDFVPRARKSAIKDGTSRWPATVAINYALRETSGGILLPPGCIVPIDGPIDIDRSNELIGGGPFDTTPGKGSKIYLLDGSNCEAIRTPYAVNPVPGSQTHFMGLRNLVIDGNKAGQTREVEGGLVKFWGAFVGSWIKGVLVLNSYGTAVDFRGGSDVEVDHLWIAACTTATGYALDTNADLSGSLLGGLMSFSNLYVENTGIDKAHDAKTEEAYRGKNIRLRRLVRGQISEVHSEGGAVAIDLDTNHTIRIGCITGYNIGSTNTDEGALVRHVGGASRAVSIGTMFYAGTSNSPYMVRKAAALASNNAIPELPFTTNPYVRGYTSSSDSAFNFDRSAKTAFTGNVAVERIGTNAEVAVQLAWGNPDSASTGRSKLKERGLGPSLSSSLNQPSNADKDFVAARSAGGSGDTLDLSDPTRLGSRTTAANIPANYIYRGSGINGTGEAILFQRVPGNNSGVSVIPTARFGFGPPTFGAEGLCQEYNDLTNRKTYKSFAVTGNTSDWTIIN